MEKFNIDIEFRDKITGAVQNILYSAFGSGGRTQIKDMRGRITFACPYCGDSHSDEHKKRGNLFWDSLKYHCYNDGCNKHNSINGLLKDFGLGQALTTDEKINIVNFIKTNSSQFASNHTSMEYEVFTNLNNLGVPLDKFYKSTKSLPITKDGPGYNILKERMLVHRIDEFATGYNRLFILNLTPDKKKVIGYQIRLLKHKAGHKYLSFSIEKLREQCGLKSPKDELGIDNMEADKINKLSTIFHILSVDFMQTVTAFEGPIDAKFIRNSIGLASVGRDLSMFEDIPSIRYLFDNDDAGKNAMRDLIKKGKTVFLWDKFMKDFKLNSLLHHVDRNFSVKDMNDIIKLCYKSKSDSYRYIDKYFSNVSIDSYYI
jgi:hypothetical protein